MSANKEKEAKTKIEKAKKLSAILNFKAFGYKIWEGPSKAQFKMTEKQFKIAKHMQKKDAIWQTCHKINSENLPR